ncbi:unnamed protein product [Linum tenue]|uniref:RING-CH-type domain-containing protein n=1 Tax=Linum tenue TaxID=586396 RepID=A0AAV0JRT9_9ROSI|nr:unnamed protein product [Linum tenue]
MDAATHKPRLASLIASTDDEPPPLQDTGDSSRRGGGDPSSGEEEEEEETEQEKSCSSDSGDEIVKASRRRGDSSSCSEDVDLELGLGQNAEIDDDEEEEGKQLHLGNNVEERDCRICHLSLDTGNEDSGFPIDLGCSCKDDLAAAHKHCAEAWFKIKGNKTCEICGSVARNVAGATEAETVVEQWNEGSDEVAVASSVAAAGQPAAEGSNAGRHFWQGHRFLNFLLACMVFAFVISWLFHFNVPS